LANAQKKKKSSEGRKRKAKREIYLFALLILPNGIAFAEDFKEKKPKKGGELRSRRRESDA
jgi:hypothetical protein